MLPAGKTGIIERNVFQQLDVRGQADPRVHSFNQVVAEQCFGRKAVAQDGLECLNVINRFAVVDSLIEVILLDVGHGTAVGVESRSVGEGSCEPGCSGAGQRDGDPRLDDREAGGADLRTRIDLHLIARMRDGFDEPPSGIRGQHSVGVQGNHVPHGLPQVSFTQYVGRALRGEEQIQVFNLASLPFAPDPAAFPLAPFARTVKEHEISLLVPLIQCGNPASSGFEESRVSRLVAVRSVQKVGEESE